jgi:hypothetical protein
MSLPPFGPSHPYIAPNENQPAVISAPQFQFVEPPPPRETPSFKDSLILLGVLLGAGIITLVVGGVGVAIWMHLHGLARDSMTTAQKLAVGIPLQVGWYALAAAVAIPIFRERWQKTFSAGVHWNSTAARARLWLLVPLGVVLSIVVAIASIKIKVPHDAPVMDLFKNATLAWVATAYGTLIAPAIEEIFFRGFLLPSIGLYTGNIVSAALTSAVFALLHAEQTGFAWGAVAILFCVSLVLCAVRLLFRSVAASTLVHVSYNSMLFLSLIHATGGYRHFEWIAK